jgi:hypothetical protein
VARTAVERGAALVERLLAERGLPVRGFTELVRVPPDAALLLVGSAPAGLARESSNLNLLALVDGDHDVVVGDQRVVRRPSAFIESILIDLDGGEVSLDVARPRTVAGLREAAEAFAILEDKAPDARRLPLLQPLEVRFLARLRDGVPLVGEKRVLRWRAEFRVDLLALAWLSSTFLTACHFLGKAQAAEAAGDAAGAAVFVRLAAEELVVAALAAAGEVVHDLRHATRLAERLARERARAPSTLRDVPGLVLGDGGAEHRDAVVRHAVELRSHVLSAPELEPAARIVRQVDPSC